MDIKNDCERTRETLKEVFTEEGYDEDVKEFVGLFDRGYEDKKQVHLHLKELRGLYLSKMQLDLAFLKAAYCEVCDEIL